MATTVARLQAVLSADTGQFTAGMDRAEHRTRTFGSRLATFGKTAALAAGTAGIGAVAITLRTGLKEWEEQTKVAAQTNAVIKSTGGVAGITAKHVDQLATSIMKKTGIDDEAIKTSENLLLGFTKIHNEVGKGNDIFDRATRLVQDYSVRTGKSATQASIIFGKALNDPVKGLGALGRAGIILTDDQKKMIKGWVEHGDKLKAQRYLLEQLETRFGGAAEAAGKTLPGQINIAKETFKNWSAELITRSIPVIQRMIGWLQDHWPQISKAINDWWSQVRPVLKAFGDYVTTVFGLIKTHWDLIAPILEHIKTAMQDAFRIIGDIFKVISALLRGDWSQAWSAFKDLVAAVLDGLWQYIQGIGDLIVAMFGGLASKIWKAFTGAWGATRDAITGAFSSLKDWIGKRVDGIVDFFVKLPGRLWASFQQAMATDWDLIKGAFGGLKDWIKQHVVDSIVNFFSNLPGRLAAVFKDDVLKPVRDAFNGIWSVIKKIKDAIQWLIDHIPDIPTPHVPSLPWGDGAGPISGGAGAGKAFHVGRQLWDEIGYGQGLGLRVTSGYRAGATTKHGTRSDHSYNPSRAVDLSGSASAMSRMFMWLLGRKEIAQAFYDPMGSIFSGAWSSYREGGHSDHIHIAEYDKGGWLKPGLTLALNNTGRPEPVGGNVVIPVSLGGEQIATIVFDMLRREAKVFENRNGRPAFGGI